MGVYFRGDYFPWGFISYLKLSGCFFRGGLCPRPTNWYHQTMSMSSSSGFGNLKQGPQFKLLMINPIYKLNSRTAHTDAQLSAIAAVIYMTATYSSGRKLNQQFICKSKLAAVKQVSYPNLEPEAETFGSGAGCFVGERNGYD